MIAGGGCEAAVIARTICRWVRIQEFHELLYGMRFPLMLKEAVVQELCKAGNFWRKLSLVPFLKGRWEFVKRREINGESNF